VLSAHLAAVLAGAGALPVAELADGESVEIGRVYVAPATFI
jgi:chemotaxis response regulator CheB